MKKGFELPPANENKTEKELTLEEKALFAGAWGEMILGSEKSLEGVEQMSDEEIAEWLSVSLAEEADKLVEEWKLEPEELLVKQVEKEKDPEKKADFEKQLILNCSEKMAEKVKEFSNQKTESRKWNSWPRLMREKGSFNCLGATMLGWRMLEKAGIRQYFGHPAGHSVNIAELSNGDWWYCDFLNGKENIKKVKAQKKKVDEFEVLEIDDDFVEYKIAELSDVKKIPFSMLGNLLALKEEAENESIDENALSKKEAANFLERFSEQFKQLDFDKLFDCLFPEDADFYGTETMQNEFKRIKLIQSANNEAGKFLARLDEDERMKVVAELNSKIDLVEKFLSGEGREFSPDPSGNATSVLNLLKEGFDKIKAVDEDAWKFSVKKMIFAIKNRG